MGTMHNAPSTLKPGQDYPKDGDVWIGWPEDMGELAREEAHYHDHFDEDAIEVHRLDSWRNRFYHERLWAALRKLEKGSHILEVGAGSGYDAKQLASDYKLTLTDISPKTLQRLHDRLDHQDVTYIAADGEKLPFVDGAFDAVFMVATWHHIEDPQAAINEAARVTRSGGRLVIGVEPNVTYFAPIKWIRPLLVRLTHMKDTEVSHADEEMVGFSYKQMKRMLRDEDWKDVEIRPMWLFAGFLHYVLEFLHRAFKTKKRLGIPQWLEKIVVGFDELLFMVPGIKHMGWHWSIIARRK